MNTKVWYLPYFEGVYHILEWCVWFILWLCIMCVYYDPCKIEKRLAWTKAWMDALRREVVHIECGFEWMNHEDKLCNLCPMYVSVRTYVCMYVRTYIHIDTYIRTYVCINMYVCMYVLTWTWDSPLYSLMFFLSW